MGIVRLVRKVACLHVVRPLDGEDLAQESLDLPVEDRRADLDPAVEVARHPVGRPDVGPFVAVVAEDEEPGVLEVLVHDADGPDPLAHALDRGAQAAGSADDQPYLDAGLAGPVEAVDDPFVGQ